jgi:hypothetical protein
VWFSLLSIQRFSDDLAESREGSGTLVRLASELLTIGCGKLPGYEPRYIKQGSVHSSSVY